MFSLSRLKDERKLAKLTQAEMAKRLDISPSSYAMYERGERQPEPNTIALISEILNISTDYLLGLTDKKQRNYYDLTEKDEKDVARMLDEMIDELDSGRELYSEDTVGYDEETRALLIGALEQAARIAKIEAKKRYTPKKYRN